MILLDSVISPPPLDSECWHQNSIIRIIMLSWSVCAESTLMTQINGKIKKDSVKDFIAFWLLFVYQKGITEYKNEYDTFIVTSGGTPSYRTIDKKCIDVIKLFRHSGSIRIRWTESGNEWRGEEILDGQVMDRTLHPSNQRLEQTLGCWRLFTSSSSHFSYFWLRQELKELQNPPALQS